jgi:hypothetical protein
MVTRSVTLTSKEHFGKRLPRHAGQMIDAISELAPRAAAMAFRGRSHGKRPKWLKAATDIRFVGHEGKDETILHFEAPVFGEAAPQEFEQGELWQLRPNAADTGFEVFADVLQDLVNNNRDSDRYDRPLLRQFYHLRRLFSDSLFDSMRVESNRIEGNLSKAFTANTIKTVRTFYQSTPNPRRVKVYGTLDMIRASTHRFAIKLPGGEEAAGVLREGNIQDYRELLSKQIVVFGKAIYRPSGRLLRIDAEKLELGTTADEFFGKIPMGVRADSDRRPKRTAQSHGGIESIFGKWPGNETDEQVSAALARL